MSANSGETTVVRQAAHVSGGRTVAAERGWSWIAEGWRMFRRAPGTWIGMAVVFAVIFFGLALIPIVGAIASTVLTPVFVAGLVIASEKIDKGGEPQFSDLFAGFQNKFGALAAIGAIYLAGMIVITIGVLLTAGVSIFSLADSSQQNPAAALALLIAILVILALMMPLLMAVWFAAPLVLFHELGAVDAMKGSFTGCLRNIIPFLVYGLIGTVFAVLASIPLLLGWLILGPVFAASVCADYRDIFLAA